MIVKLLTEHHLEFLSLKGGYRGSSETTHVKIPHCWKSHAAAHLVFFNIHLFQTIFYKNVSRARSTYTATNNRLADSRWRSINVLSYSLTLINAGVNRELLLRKPDWK